MSALDELNERQERGENLTPLEFAVWWCTDLISGIKAAEELAAKDTELSALRAEVERLKEVKSKAAIVIAGWELMSKTSDYDLDELKEALRKYVNQ